MADRAGALCSNRLSAIDSADTFGSMRIRRSAATAAVIMAITIAGCGSSKPKTSGDNAGLGRAIGGGLVHQLQGVKIIAAPQLAADFTSWVDGKDSDSSVSAPSTPISASERSAAAKVVIKFADTLVADGRLQSTMPSGQSVIDYLTKHGVSRRQRRGRSQKR